MALVTLVYANIAISWQLLRFNSLRKLRLNFPQIYRFKRFENGLEKKFPDLKFFSLILAEKPLFFPDFPDWTKSSKFSLNSLISLIGGNPGRTYYSSYQMSAPVRGSQVNKFEQVSGPGYQMSLAEGVHKWTSLNRSPVLVTRCHYHGGWGEGQGRGGGLYRLGLGKGSLYGEVQCFTGNGQMPPPRTDRHDWKHYLPTTSLAGGYYMVPLGGRHTKSSSNLPVITKLITRRTRLYFC